MRLPGSAAFGTGERPDDAGDVLLSLGSRLYRLQAELLAGLDPPLTVRQYRILSRVSGGHTSLTALCRLAHRNPSTMSESVDKLVRIGLLSRGTVDTNRRTMRLALTRAGRAAREAGDRALGKFTAELAAGIPGRLHEDLRGCLTGLYRDIQQDLDDR